MHKYDQGNLALFTLNKKHILYLLAIHFSKSNLHTLAWHQATKRSVELYPALLFEYISTDIHKARCDLCRRKRILSSVLNLSGQPYDERSLHTDSSDDLETFKDFNKLELSPLTLGTWCSLRIQMYHKVCHFKFTLFCKIKELCEGLQSDNKQIKLACENASTRDDLINISELIFYELGRTGTSTL